MTLYSSMRFPDYVFQEYPKWVKGIDGESVIVNSKKEEDIVLGKASLEDTSKKKFSDEKLTLKKE